MKLNELLGTEFPLIQGGMANIATGEFAAAVSNAGALGLIGAGGMNADSLRDNIRRCKELTDKPFGVNIMLMKPAAPEMAKVVVEEGVKVVTTGAGVPSQYVPAWKEAGIKVFPVVAATALVRRLAPLGVDGFIAEGTESGGHVGELTTMALVPQVCAMTDLPGAKRCMPLKVSGPFHTKLMKPAGDALRAHFKTITFHKMEFPVYFNCKGAPKAEDWTCRSAGAAGPVHRLLGGYHPAHGGGRSGHHRGDRAGQDPVRLCEENRFLYPDLQH